MRNMAVFAHSVHLGRFAFAAVFLLSFLVSGAWGACYEYTIQGNVAEYSYNRWVNDFYYGCRGPACTQNGYGTCPTPSCPVSVNCGNNRTCYNPTSILEKNPNWNCSNGQNGSQNFICYYSHVCDTQCDGDSLVCVLKGADWEWKGCELGCVENTCDAQCECEEAGGTWETSNGGYCVPVCQSQFCCDSLNQNLPTQTDTTWEGCVVTDPSNDKCVVLPTVENNTGSTQAECTAKSRYRV